MSFTKLTSDVLNVYTYNNSPATSANAGQIVALDSSGKLPQGLSGANITGISGGTGSTLTWTTITSNTAATANYGYFCNSTAQIQITLPSSPTVGNTIEVTGMGTGGFLVIPASGQIIYWNNGLSASGSIGLAGTSTSVVHLIYTSTNTWVVDNYKGIVSQPIPDPFWNNVVLSMPLNGSIQDISGNNLAFTNTGGVSTQSPQLFGNQSVYFSGNTTYASSAYNASNWCSADITIEAWAYFTAAPSVTSMIMILGNSAPNNVWFGVQNNLMPTASWNSQTVITGTTAITLNKWHHFAQVRQGTLGMFFVDGVLIGTSSWTVNTLTSAGICLAGYYGNATYGGYYYMANARVTTGIARYVTNFTIPTNVFPSSLDNTYDPVWNDVTFRPSAVTLSDLSNNNIPLYFYGTPSTSKSITIQDSASFYFNGSSSMNYAPGGTIAAVPSAPAQFYGDFTVEFWINNQNSTAGYIFGTDSTSSTTGILLAINASNIITVNVSSATVILTTTGTAPVGVWTHIAMVRLGGILMVYANGVNVGSVANSTIFTDTKLAFGAGANSFGEGTKNCYMSGIRITKFARYTANFTVPYQTTSSLPSSFDPYWNETTLLLGFENNLTDQSNVSLAMTNTNVTYTALSTLFAGPKFGAAGCAYFNGTAASYITVANTGNATKFNGDFTIECWHYPTSLSVGGGLISTNITSINRVTGITMYCQGSKLSIYQNSANIITGTTTMTINNWYHCAVTRQGSTVTLWLNGVSQGSAVLSTALTDGGLLVGATNSLTSGSDLCQGYVQDVRVVNGIAVYTSAFTPPTSTLTAITNTTALFHLDTGALVDSSINGLIATNNSTLVTCFNNLQGSYAAYFNGSNAYAQPTTLPQNAFTGDFTIECWVYAVALPGTGGLSPIVQAFSSGSSSTGFLYCLYNSGGTTYLSIDFGGSFHSTTATITAGSWYHCAFVRQGAANTLYVNGIGTNVLNNSAAYPDTNTYFQIGGAVLYSVYFNGYIDNFRVTKYARYTANFNLSTPPTYLTNGLTTTVAPVISSTTVDPFYTNVTALLPLNGTTADYSGNNLPLTNTAVSFVTPQPTKFNSQVAYFNGSTNYLTGPTGAATKFYSDFTVEFWTYVTSTATNPTFICTMTGTNTSTGFFISIDGNGNHYAFSTGGSNIIDAGTVPLNTWVHIAVTKQGSLVSLYANGILQASATTSNVFSDGGLILGKLYWSAANNLNGYMSNLRITNGVARYTSNFTVPSQPFGYITDSSADPVWNKTVSELSLNGNLTDVSGAIQSYYNNGYSSAYFNGSAVLSTANNAAFQYSGQFTVECFVFPTSYTISSYPGYLFDSRSGGGTAGFGLQFNTSGQLQFQYQAASLGTTTASVPLNTWSHVAATRNSSNVITVWINGVGNVIGTLALNFTDGTMNIGQSAPSSSYKYVGYMQDFRINNTTALYTGTFTPPTSQLTVGTGTSGLFHLNGNILDYSGNNVVLTNTSVTYSQPINSNVFTGPVNSGSGSGYFNGSAYLTGGTGSGTAFGTNAFTIELWAFPLSAGTNNCILDTRNVNTSSNGLMFRWNTAAGQILIYNGAIVLTSTINAVLNQWNHIAVVRNSSVITLYINGIVAGTTANSTNYTDSSLVIGNFQGGGGLFTGYMQDVRVVNGTAVYTGTFTPPTAALTAVSNTTALFHLYNSAADSSTNNLQLVNTSVTFYQQTPTLNSTYFNGSAYLSLPTVQVTNIQPGLQGPYTLEMWIYTNQIGTAKTIWERGGGVNNWNVAGGIQIQIYLNTSGTIAYQWYSGTGVATITSSAAIITNTWYHLAVTYDGTTTTLWINGVSTGTPLTSVYTASASPTIISFAADTTLNTQMFTGNVALFRYSRFQRYSSTFVPPTSYQTALPTTYDPYWQDVTFMPRASITGGSDVSGNALVLTNVATTISATSKQDTYAWVFNGTSTLYTATTTATQFSGDFTMEAWVYPTTIGTNPIIIGGINSGVQVYLPTGTFIPHLSISGGANVITSSTPLTQNAWSHVAVVKQGGNSTMYINGVSVGTSTDANNYTVNGNVGVGTGFTGSIAGYRLTKAARYIANFTPPTTPFLTVGAV